VPASLTRIVVACLATIPFHTSLLPISIPFTIPKRSKTNLPTYPIIPNLLFHCTQDCSHRAKTTTFHCLLCCIMPRDRLEASIYFNNCHSHLSAALEIQQRYSSFLVDRAGSEVVYTQSRDKYQPMMLPKICASKSKKEFCRHLGLSESDERDRRLYREMMVSLSMHHRHCYCPRH